ncbi:MAG: hypothetical protein IJ797_07050 [Selenomonadaceae bacterium]|nr:hypothetical protein [Selenomonadaceae bacterium]
MSWIKRFFWGLSVLSFSIVSAASASAIQDVEAVTEVFGDGENLSAVILTYDKAILGQSVSIEDFEVINRKIINAYVNDTPEKGKGDASAGRYIVLELEPLPLVDQMPEQHSLEDRNERAAKGFHGPTLGSHGNPQALPTFSAEVKQLGIVKATDGTIYAPSSIIKSSHTRQLLVENFTQDIYYDVQQNNAQLMYNLYIPQNYDPNKKYPLVVFMHDAGAVSPQIKTAILQGRGAVAWTTPEWQAKYPCFVLAPQYDVVIVDDNYQYGPELDRTIHLIEYLETKYPIDKDRIYNTGQSMGGMTSIAMDVKYPDFFAASYLVACKWNADVTAPLGQQNIWAVASEGDPGAFPSMNQIFDNLERDGAETTRLTIDASQDQDIINKAADSMIKSDCHIYYTIYKGGNHRYTWLHAYDMLPAMEWIFAQSK